jgi:hypothetical protein
MKQTMKETVTAVVEATTVHYTFTPRKFSGIQLQMYHLHTPTLSTFWKKNQRT